MHKYSKASPHMLNSALNIASAFCLARDDRRNYSSSLSWSHLYPAWWPLREMMTFCSYSLVISCYDDQILAFFVPFMLTHSSVIRGQACVSRSPPSSNRQFSLLSPLLQKSCWAVDEILCWPSVITHNQTESSSSKENAGAQMTKTRLGREELVVEVVGSNTECGPSESRGRGVRSQGSVVPKMWLVTLWLWTWYTKLKVTHGFWSPNFRHRSVTMSPHQCQWDRGPLIGSSTEARESKATKKSQRQLIIQFEVFFFNVEIHHMAKVCWHETITHICAFWTFHFKPPLPL